MANPLEQAQSSVYNAMQAYLGKADYDSAYDLNRDGKVLYDDVDALNKQYVAMLDERVAATNQILKKGEANRNYFTVTRQDIAENPELTPQQLANNTVVNYWSTQSEPYSRVMTAINNGTAKFGRDDEGNLTLTAGGHPGWDTLTLRPTGTPNVYSFSVYNQVAAGNISGAIVANPETGIIAPIMDASTQFGYTPGSPGGFIRNLVGGVMGAVSDLGPVGALALAYVTGGAGVAIGEALGLSGAAAAVAGNTIINTALNGGDVGKALTGSLASYAGAEAGGLAGEVAKNGELGEFLKANPDYASLIAGAATKTLALGGNVEDAIKNATIGVAAEAATDQIPNFKNYDSSVQSAIKTAIYQELQGKDVNLPNLITNAATTGLASYALNQLPEYKNADPKLKSLIASQVSAGLSGRPLDQAAINWAMSQGSKAISDSVKTTTTPETKQIVDVFNNPNVVVGEGTQVAGPGGVTGGETATNDSLGMPSELKSEIATYLSSNAGKDSSITKDQDGVYTVYDPSNARTLKFSSDGTFLGQTASVSVEEGQTKPLAADLMKSLEKIFPPAEKGEGAGADNTYTYSQGVGGTDTGASGSGVGSGAGAGTSVTTGAGSGAGTGSTAESSGAGAGAGADTGTNTAAADSAGAGAGAGSGAGTGFADNLTDQQVRTILDGGAGSGAGTSVTAGAGAVTGTSTGSESGTASTGTGAGSGAGAGAGSVSNVATDTGAGSGAGSGAGAGTSVTTADVESAISSYLAAHPGLKTSDVTSAVEAYMTAHPGLSPTDLSSAVNEATKDLVTATTLQTTVDTLKADLTKAISDAQSGDADAFKKINEALDSLKQNGLTSTDVQALIDASSTGLSSNFKAALDSANAGNAAALDTLKADLETRLTTGQTETRTALDTLNTNLSKAISDAVAAGATGDAALQSGLDKVASDLNTTKTSLLTQLGKSEADLKADFSSQLTGVQTQITAGQEATNKAIEALDASTKAKFELLTDAQKDQAIQLADTTKDLKGSIDAVSDVVTQNQAATQARFDTVQAALDAASEQNTALSGQIGALQTAQAAAADRGVRSALAQQAQQQLATDTGTNNWKQPELKATGLTAAEAKPSTYEAIYKPEQVELVKSPLTQAGQNMDLNGLNPQLMQLLAERSQQQPQAQTGYYNYGSEGSAFNMGPAAFSGGQAPTMGFAGGGLAMASPLMAAAGGVPHKGSHYVQGAGGGQDDLIDARLADGEYVFDADIVAALGDGSNKEGAKKLDAMREAIRKHKRAAPLNSIPPKAKSPLSYLKGVK